MHLENFIDSFNLLSSSQHGFKMTKSINTAAYQVLEFVYRFLTIRFTRWLSFSTLIKHLIALILGKFNVTNSSFLINRNIQMKIDLFKSINLQKE